MAATGRLVVTAGLVGSGPDGKVVAPDFPAQLRQLLKNTVAVLAEAGAEPSQIVRMTWYILDIAEYRRDAAAIGAAYLEVMGRHFPAMAVVQVAALMDDGARVEIETTAVAPE
jgi:enamine deaminase RidA (YjgF/YER057c/UK114 family)